MFVHEDRIWLDFGSKIAHAAPMWVDFWSKFGIVVPYWLDLEVSGTILKLRSLLEPLRTEKV